jgi:hypothetical protein
MRSFRPQIFEAASSAKASECRIIREGFVTVTGRMLIESRSEINDFPGLGNLCEKLDQQLQPTQPRQPISSPTRLPPASVLDAVSRLRKCKMPEQSNDGSNLLYSLVAFAVEKWKFSDEQIVEIIEQYHGGTPLRMLTSSKNPRETITIRIAQARKRLGIEPPIRPMASNQIWTP